MLPHDKFRKENIGLRHRELERWNWPLKHCEKGGVKTKMFGRRGDNEQGEEVWEVSSSPKSAGGPEEGSEEGEKSKMLTRSKELVLELGLGEGKHVDECVWECRATDQWVTLQKKSPVGIR